MRNSVIVIRTLLCALVVAGQPALRGEGPITFSLPGTGATLANGINDRGDISGYYLGAGGTHGFVWSNGEYQTIDVPGGVGRTWVYGINDRREVVGCFNNGQHSSGFLFDGRSFTVLDIPGATAVCIYAINARGEMVGVYYGNSSASHGVVFARDGSYRIVDTPGATYTFLSGVNARGDVVGLFDAAGHAAVLSGGNLRALDPAVYVKAINDAGDMAGGVRQPSDTKLHAAVFRWRPNSDVTVRAYIDVPGATATLPTGINNRGCVVGQYSSSGSPYNSFVWCLD